MNKKVTRKSFIGITKEEEDYDRDEICTECGEPIIVCTCNEEEKEAWEILEKDFNKKQPKESLIEKKEKLC